MPRRTNVRYGMRYGRVVCDLADHFVFAEYEPEENDLMIRMVALALGVEPERLVGEIKKQMEPPL